VDKSLESKLKCLIFIPILSQTYCDPKSFAWQHEFCAFNNKAKAEAVGRDITLASGNVSSRILPVKIHDLDPEDKQVLESEMGAVLRAVEFIFRSSGVNRPLRAQEEHPQDNLNKTFHRDQINKMANAIKEILAAMRNSETPREPHTGTEKPSSTPGRKKIAMVASMIGLLMLSALWYMFYGKASKSSAELEDVQNSIAVLPFVNMSQDPEQEYFSDGITEQIITNLAHINSLKVIARTSVMKFKKTEKSIAEIGKELNVTHVLEGSIRRSGDRVRVTAQLISVNDETHLWAQDYDRPLADIFTVQDEVSRAIASSLQRRLTPREYETLKGQRPASVEAYHHYLKGYYTHFDLFYIKRLKEDFIRAENEFKAALQLDPSYGLAYAGLADLYDSYRNLVAQGQEERLRFENLRDSCIIISMRLSPNDPYTIAVRAYSFYSNTDRTEADMDSAFKYMKRAYAIAPNNSAVCDQLSMAYSSLGLYDQAIRLRERSIGLDPTYGNYYSQLGFLYMQLGEFKKSEEAIKKALLMEPEDVNGLQTLGWVKLIMGDTAGAESIIQRIREISPEIGSRGQLGYLFALKGDKERALGQSKLWFVYLALGMKKEALDRIESSEDLSYLFMKNSPVFNPLKQEPRFAAFLEKAHLLYEERLKKYAN
jgi:TolB-like protein/Tfp pilus assembly protein PilF